MISTGGDETLATGAGTELLAGWAGLASAGSRSLGPNLRQSELAQAHSGAGCQYWAEWAEGPAQAVHNGKHEQSAGSDLTTNPQGF